MKTSFQDVIWNRRWFVLGVLILAVLLSPILLKLTYPTYSGEAEIVYVGKGEDAVIQPADLPELVLSTGVLERAIAEGHIDLSITDLLKKVSVRQSPHSDIVPVDFRSEDSALAIKVPNAIVDATISEYKLLATRQYDEVIGKLNAKRENLRERIQFFDNQYQSSVRKDPMAGVTMGLDNLSTQLGALDEARVSARAKLSQDVAAASGSAIDSSAPGVSSVIREESVQHDPVLIALTSQHAKDLADYENTRAGYTDRFPGLAGLRQKVASEAKALDREENSPVHDRRGASPTYATLLVTQRAAQTLVKADEGQVNELDKQYGALRDRLTRLPKLTVPADNYRVQRDGANAAYTQAETALLSAYAAKAQAGSLNSVVLLNHAYRAKPNLAQPVKALLILFLIFAFAIGIAYVAEALNPRIRTRIDIESLYGAPLIGSI